MKQELVDHVWSVWTGDSGPPSSHTLRSFAAYRPNVRVVITPHLFGRNLESVAPVVLDYEAEWYTFGLLAKWSVN